MRRLLSIRLKAFINSVGALAVTENAPYTLLRDGYGRRVSGESYDLTRKNKHLIFLNFEQNKSEISVREKIAARARLEDWLNEQNAESGRVIKTWKIEN